MKKISEPIVFFGSGPVAAKSLEYLEKYFNIELVVTRTTPQNHRGIVPVAELCNKKNIRFYQVSDGKELIKLVNHIEISNLGVLVDFGIILSSEVIKKFSLGIINSHFSLLPEWRGADPITFSILSGQKVTGVSLMLIVMNMDEGPLLDSAKYVIPDDIRIDGLTDKLINISNELLTKDIPLYINGEIFSYPQDKNVKPTYSRKINKLDGKIDWHKSAIQLEREIRAYALWPKSYTTLKGIEVIITSAHVIRENDTPGKFRIGKNKLTIFCGTGALEVNRIQPSGKREMEIKSFLAGYYKYLES